MALDPRTKVLMETGDKLFPSVTYEISAEGYAENYQDGTPSITMRTRTRWGRSGDFLVNALGSAGTDSVRTSGVTRQTPIKFPDDSYSAMDVSDASSHTPFLGWWCTSARLSGTTSELSCQYQDSGALVPPLNATNQLVSGTDYDPITGNLIDAGYDSSNNAVQAGIGFAEYDLTFEPLPFEIRTDDEMDALPAPLNGCELSRYVIRRERFGGNNFTLQPGTLYWRDRLLANANDPNAQILSEAVRPFPNSNVTYTLLNMPGINRAAITAAIGTVNKAEVGAGAPSGKFDYRPDWQGITWTDCPIDGFLPGTLLFEGVSDIVPKVTSSGQLLYDITMNFFYRPDGHNKIYRAADDSFQRVVRVATKSLPSGSWKDMLDETTFTDLFKL